MWTKNRGSKRLRYRGANGRFRRPTLESAFGIRAIVCAECRRINTVGIGEARPENCHACGKPLRDISEIEKK